LPVKITKPEGDRLSFDQALAKAAPHLNSPERTFVAAVGGMGDANLFRDTVFADIEGLPCGKAGAAALVTFIGPAWKRTVGLKYQQSKYFELTAAGRALVLAAARLIEGGA
jgi:hypothetical protein